MHITVEEKLGRIDEKLDYISKALPNMCDDIEDLKEFKWKIWGAIGVVVPIYTAAVAGVVSLMMHYGLGW